MSESTLKSNSILRSLYFQQSANDTQSSYLKSVLFICDNIIIYGGKPKESTKKLVEIKVNIQNIGTNSWKLKLKNNTIYNGIKMYKVIWERCNNNNKMFKTNAPKITKHCQEKLKIT